MITQLEIYQEIEGIWTAPTIGRPKFFLRKLCSINLRRFRKIELKTRSPKWSNILNLTEIAIRNCEVLQIAFTKLEVKNKRKP
jgi:hypothetical protein